MLIKGIKYNSFIFLKNPFCGGGRGVVCRRRKTQEETFSCRGFVQENATKAYPSVKKKKIILYKRQTQKQTTMILYAN